MFYSPLKPFQVKGGRGWKEREASLYEGRLDDQRGVEINSELPDFLKNPTRLSDKVENQESADVKENELSEDERAKAKAEGLRLPKAKAVKTWGRPPL